MYPVIFIHRPIDGTGKCLPEPNQYTEIEHTGQYSVCKFCDDRVTHSLVLVPFPGKEDIACKMGFWWDWTGWYCWTGYE